MSSHHIVRENQEPALLVLDRHTLDEELFGQLLEWSPIVITTEDYLPYFISQQIKVDLVLVSTEKSLPDIAQQVESLFVKPNEILEKSFSYLEKRKQQSVYILTNDYTFQEIGKYVDHYNIVIFSRNIRYTLTATYEKWLPKDTTLEIKDFDDRHYSIEGLAKMDRNLFKTHKDGFVRVNSTSGTKVCIGEQL